MSYPICKTTIDQHRGTHEPSGLPMMELTDIVTDLGPYADKSWNDLSADDQQWWVVTTEQYHEARVALAELDADLRERADAIIYEEGATDALDDQAGVILRAIEEAKAERVEVQ